MSGRSNWYSDHPPACTCAACRGTGRSRRGRRGSRRRDTYGTYYNDGVRQRRSGGADSRPAFRLRRVVRAAVRLAVIAAFAACVLWFLRNDDTRAEVLDWISTQTDVVADRVREVSDSSESRTSPSEIRTVPTTLARSAPPEGQVSVSTTETAPRPAESTASRDLDPSLRYPGEGPLDVGDVEAWILRFTNDERERAGLNAFVHDPAISDIARAHSEKMVRFGLTHDIQGMDPTDRALAAGYDCRAYHGDGSYSYGLSENVAEHPRVTHWSGVGFGGGSTRWRPVEFDSDSRAMALGLVMGWMDSPGHRANILDRDARRIGVGVAIAEVPENGWTHETVFATQNFSACR